MVSRSPMPNTRVTDITHYRDESGRLPSLPSFQRLPSGDRRPARSDRGSRRSSHRHPHREERSPWCLEKGLRRVPQLPRAVKIFRENACPAWFFSLVSFRIGSYRLASIRTRREHFLDTSKRVFRNTGGSVDADDQG
jgi:hypothetical protein